MKTYRLEYKLADGRKVLDPTVFRTRESAANRIAIFTNKKGVVIKVVRI